MIAKANRSMIRYTLYRPRAIRKNKIRHSFRKEIMMGIQFREFLAFREAHQTRKRLFPVIRAGPECSLITWICQLINKISQHRCLSHFHPFHLNLSIQMIISTSLLNLPRKNSIARAQEGA